MSLSKIVYVLSKEGAGGYVPAFPWFSRFVLPEVEIAGKPVYQIREVDIPDWMAPDEFCQPQFRRGLQSLKVTLQHVGISPFPFCRRGFFRLIVMSIAEQLLFLKIFRDSKADGHREVHTWLSARAPRTSVPLGNHLWDERLQGKNIQDEARRIKKVVDWETRHNLEGRKILEDTVRIGCNDLQFRISPVHGLLPTLLPQVIQDQLMVVMSAGGGHGQRLVLESIPLDLSGQAELYFGPGRVDVRLVCTDPSWFEVDKGLASRVPCKNGFIRIHGHDLPIVSESHRTFLVDRGQTLSNLFAKVRQAERGVRFRAERGRMNLEYSLQVLQGRAGQILFGREGGGLQICSALSPQRCLSKLSALGICST